MFLSLYSTQNLMDEALKSFIAKYRETGGRVYVGGPVSAVPEMVLGELAPDAVICGEGEAGGALALLRDGISESVPGIAFTGPDGIISTGPASPCPVSRPLPSFLRISPCRTSGGGISLYRDTTGLYWCLHLLPGASLLRA